MKNLIPRTLLLLSIAIIISSGKVLCQNPLKLYAELDTNSMPNTLAKKERKNGWKLLFNGKTTDGWHGYNLNISPECWAVENGTMTAKSTGGAEDLDIVTNKSYKNFAFAIDYKLTKQTNSGIIFQVAEDSKYKYPYETGPEYQIIDQENWPDPLENWQTSGANYAMYPPMNKPYKPIGEWNHVFIVVDGNKVTQMLNGVVVVEYIKNSDEWKKLRNSGKWADFPDWGIYDQGHISLQNHGSKIWFRNIKIKEL